MKEENSIRGVDKKKFTNQMIKLKLSMGLLSNLVPMAFSLSWG